MHPLAYTLMHRLKYACLPAPYGYTEAHAGGYFIDTVYRKGTITPFAGTPPFPLRPAVLNQMYEIDCVMVGPGALLMQTPLEWRQYFARVEFESVFGHIFSPGKLLLATKVLPGGPDFRVSETTRARWAEERRWMPVTRETYEC